MTALEGNGGDGGNSSVAELEMRVETLEGTAVDHETRISAMESDVNGSVTCVGFFPIVLKTVKFQSRKKIQMSN